MPGLTITVGAVDITAYVDVHSINIEEVGTEIVATCRFRVRDHSGTVDIVAKNAVDIDDDGTTIFAGEVAQAEEGQEGITKTWLVTCHDYNILLDETVIEDESYTAGTTDAAILADLFTTYRSDIDAVTHVSTLDASMEAVGWEGMTLREILDDLASRTGARYYVDYDKYLHWFDTESNNAAFSLSTSPDMVLSFPFGGFQRVRSGAKIADKVFVLGQGASGWYPAGAPTYDGSTRHAVSRDRRITTTQGVEDRGQAIYSRYNSERLTYQLWTEHDGLRAGQSVTVVNATWSINAAFYIRRIRVEVLGADGERRRYHLELNDEAPEPSRSARQQQILIARLETELNSVGDAVFDVDAPAAPNALGAGNVTTGVTLDADGKQIVWAEITWSEVTDTDLNRYELQLSTQSDFSSDVITRTHPAGGGRRERFVGLVGNTTYYVRVRAEDWAGNDSAWDYGAGSPYSFTSSADTSAPAQVAGLSASSARTIVGLSWTANSESDLRFYEIQRAPDSAGSPGVWATIAYAQLNFYVDQDFSDAQIAAEDTFWYRVRAIDTSANEGTWATQTSVALGQITTDHIAAGTITADNIAGNTITANKMNVTELSAIAANLGTITAGTVTGATVRTAASGARVVLDSTDGIRVFNGSGTLTAQFDVDGSGQLGSSDYEPIVWNAAGQIDKIKANQIDLGDPGIFSALDGLLLLGPNCPMTETSWTSLRGQEAMISGAFHHVAGYWPGSRALVIEGGTTNLCVNPVFEVNVTDGWSDSAGIVTRSTTRFFAGSASAKITGDGTSAAFVADSVSVGDGETIHFQCRLWRPQVGAGYFYFYDGTNGAVRNGVQGLGGTYEWGLITHSWTNDTGAPASVTCRIRNDGNALDMWVDAVQIEIGDAQTTFCYGGQSWSAWSGTAHNSTSTRSLTTINVPDAANLLSGADTYTIRCVVQTQYDSDGDWPSGTFNALFNGDATDLMLYYDPGDGRFEYLISGGNRMTASSFSFSQGDWLDIVVVSDANSGALYVNGELVGSSGLVTLPSLGNFYLASRNAGAYNGNFIFSEFSIFDTVLTAEQVAALYQRNAPLIDAGAYDTPGIYILDGRFRIASATSGNRIEITADEVAGYNSAGTKQFYLSAEDGKAYFAGGSAVLDVNGIAIETSGLSGYPITFTNDDISVYTNAEAYINLQDTDPNSQTYGAFNFGITHDANNRSYVTAWLNEIDLLIQKSGNYRNVLEANYDYIRVNSIPFRVGTGTADPLTSIEDGMLFYRTDTDKLRLRANGAWNDLNRIPVSGDFDHGGLSGLGDDDHTQYLLANGTRSLTGNLNMNGHDIKSADFVYLNSIGTAHPASPSFGIIFYHAVVGGVNGLWMKFSDGHVTLVAQY